ncbi:MAG: hypothetical protein J6U92_00505, partial [Clostridia bacterium]|nr:hypothetical protein [Clostridia bacterium]
DRVFVDIQLLNVTGQSNFIVSKLNGHGMNDSRFDSIAPKVIYDEILADYSVGDVVIISPFKAYDFIDPSATFSYYVLDQNGNYVVSDCGIILDGKQDCTKSYELTLNTYVTYSLYGEAVDFTPTNKTRISRNISIVDKVLPTIELNITANIFALGEITLASYTASDDMGEVTVDIVVYMPNAKVVYSANGKFNATIKGEHKVVYRATDKAGNVCFAEYVFMVK